MIDISPFTQEQWWQLCNCNCDLPIPLEKADLTKPFVYHRKYGLFYVPSGSHNLTMATFLAFDHGFDKPLEVCTSLGIKLGISHCSDYWLEHTQGAAFKSSVSPKVQAGKRKHLNQKEKDYFGNISYIFD